MKGYDTKDLLLEVRNLRTYMKLDEGILKAVDDVSFPIRRRETLGIVGESGCGKSVTAQSVMRIIPPFAGSTGSVLFYRQKGAGRENAVDLVSLDPSGREVRAIRGRDITMIFQEPMTSFSPLYTVGSQISEAILLHRTRSKSEAKALSVRMLDKVGIPKPQQIVEEYPHQLSGGMRQRAMIAMALSCNPSLLIADEPTTALDVTIQAQVLALMQELQEEFGMAMMYITHDLGVIAEIADNVAVMYLGRIVEYGSTDDIFYSTAHPYTKALLASLPKMGAARTPRLSTIPGSVPIPIGLPRQCPFFNRCGERIARRCEEDIPPFVEVGEDHFVRCILYQD